MSSRGSAEWLRARDRVRFSHAIMRLKTRFDFEIEFDEYMAICEKFKSGQVQGARRNHRGDIEGWVEIRGTPICCYFHVDEGLVGTFFANAPPQPGADNTWQGKYDVLRKQYDKLNAKYAKLVEQVKQDEAPDTRTDIGWFKERIREASSMLTDGDLGEVRYLLEALVAVPRAMRPSKDLAAAASFLAGAVDEKREHYEAGLDRRKNAANS